MINVNDGVSSRGSQLSQVGLKAGPGRDISLSLYQFLQDCELLIIISEWSRSGYNWEVTCLETD